MQPVLQPYLCFEGNCREAMEFYKGVLGGELEVSTFGDMGMKDPADNADKVMHSTLKNDMLSFMASDAMPNGKVTFGDSVSLSIVGKDEEKLTKFFEGLSEGGKVTMPLEKQMWGDKFGMFTDKFGIHWMVNITMPGSMTDEKKA